MVDTQHWWPGVVRVGWRVERHMEDVRAMMACPVDRATAVRVPITEGIVAYVPAMPVACVESMPGMSLCVERWVQRPVADVHARDVLVCAHRKVSVEGLALLGLPMQGERIAAGQTWYTIVCIAVQTIGCGIV